MSGANAKYLQQPSAWLPQLLHLPDTPLKLLPLEVRLAVASLQVGSDLGVVLKDGRTTLTHDGLAGWRIPVL